MDPPHRERIASLDAFRGFTILGMVLVICVAAFDYQHAPEPLPPVASWLDSPPVSAWLHAAVGWELRHEAAVAAGAEPAQLAAHEERARRGVGCTFADLIAPWFVLVVGMCVPLARRRRGAAGFERHALSRALLLVLLGVVYMSLVIRQVSYWWGVLQAIGVAYLCAVWACRLSVWGRWALIFGAGGLNLLLTATVSWWTTAGEGAGWNPLTLSNPGGDWFRPLIVHCQPWLSLSYGQVAVIGGLLGEALLDGARGTILRRGLLIGGLFTGLGYGMHKVGVSTGVPALCVSKPDVTTAYAFFTAGLGTLVFLGAYWLIDVRRMRRWARPLDVFGTNPLVAYLLMIVMRRAFDALGLTSPDGRDGIWARVTADNTFVNSWATWVGGDAPSDAVLWLFAKGGLHGLLWALAWTLCLWAIVRWCNRRGLYLRL